MPPEPGEGRAPKPSITTDLVWLSNLGIIMRYWMMWPNAPTPGWPEDKRTTVRGFALVVIVALTFAIRGDIPPDQFDSKRFAAIAAGLAVLLSFALHILSRAARDDAREQVIISAYASIIWVMALETVVEALRGIAILDGFKEKFGEPNVAVVIACTITALIFFLKGFVYDRVGFTLRGSIYGILMILGAGLIARIVSLVSTESFKATTDLLKKIAS